MESSDKDYYQYYWFTSIIITDHYYYCYDCYHHYYCDCCHNSKCEGMKYLQAFRGKNCDDAILHPQRVNRELGPEMSCGLNSVKGDYIGGPPTQ